MRDSFFGGFDSFGMGQDPFSNPPPVYPTQLNMAPQMATTGFGQADQRFSAPDDTILGGNYISPTAPQAPTGGRGGFGSQTPTYRPPYRYESQQPQGPSSYAESFKPNKPNFWTANPGGGAGFNFNVGANAPMPDNYQKPVAQMTPGAGGYMGPGNPNQPPVQSTGPGGLQALNPFGAMKPKIDPQQGWQNTYDKNSIMKEKLGAGGNRWDFERLAPLLGALGNFF